MALPPFVNGFQPFLKNNSDMLLQAGAGLLGGQTAPEQVAGLAQGVAGVRQRNKTLEFLRQQNPELAAAVESGALSGGDAYKLFFQQKLEAQKPRNNLIPVGKNLYDFQNGEWIAPPAGIAANDVEAGLNLVYGKDKDGNTVAFQPLKTGGLRQVEVPQGTALTPGITNLDLGTSILTLNNKTGTQVSNTPKDLAGAAREAKVGGAEGEAVASYKSLSSKMPGLMTVIDKLDTLADKATYTAAGQALDLGRKQFGMEPRDSAIARAEYISTVDNQVLPLLRDTFGAAFTQKEGDTLRATLGDPDKSPQEKKAVLRSFIEQKTRDLEALATQSGQTAPGTTGARTSSGIGWSIEP